MATLRHTDPKQWLRDRVFVAPDGCWLWLGPATLKGKGYGLLVTGPRTARVYIIAHRFAYEAFRGPVPDGLELDHIVCDQKLCCNPWHLKAVTHRENMLRGRGISAENARKTHCKHGHELAGDNLRIYIRKNGGVQRSCQTCNRRHFDAAYAARKRVAA